MSRGFTFLLVSLSEDESEIAVGVAPGADVGPRAGRSELRGTSDTFDKISVDRSDDLVESHTSRLLTDAATCSRRIAGNAVRNAIGPCCIVN